ncbi:MAG: hypothetical protein ACK50V_05110 [Alphaproteobacteria bacterium]|jgi:hypothetical protein|nr:hypothetical protein [Alphaproteobacteria bacterium]
MDNKENTTPLPGAGNAPRVYKSFFVPHRTSTVFDLKNPHLVWETSHDWVARKRFSFPPLFTTDFAVLKEAFCEAFFLSPKGQELIARQNTWNVDIKEEMAKPTAGLFEPAIKRMQNVNMKRFEDLARLRLLELYEHPTDTHQPWIHLRVHPDDKGPLCTLNPVEWVEKPPQVLCGTSYMAGLFGPKNTSLQDLYQALFCTRLKDTKAEPSSWVAFAHVDPPYDQPLIMRLLPHEFLELCS